MAHIIKVLGWVNNGDYAVVEVQLDDGGTASIYVGGQVETWFDHAHNRIKAHVRRAQSRGKLDNKLDTLTITRYTGVRVKKGSQTKMRKVYKYGTGDEVPEGAVYLTTEVQEGLMRFVWHYFLVEVKDVKN